MITSCIKVNYYERFMEQTLLTKYGRMRVKRF